MAYKEDSSSMAFFRLAVEISFTNPPLVNGHRRFSSVVNLDKTESRGVCYGLRSDDEMN
jgi:hypothetical protein